MTSNTNTTNTTDHRDEIVSGSILDFDSIKEAVTTAGPNTAVFHFSWPQPEQGKAYIPARVVEGRVQKVIELFNQLLANGGREKTVQGREGYARTWAKLRGNNAKLAFALQGPDGKVVVRYWESRRRMNVDAQAYAKAYGEPVGERHFNDVRNVQATDLLLRGCEALADIRRYASWAAHLDRHSDDVIAANPGEHPAKALRRMILPLFGTAYEDRWHRLTTKTSDANPMVGIETVPTVDASPASSLREEIEEILAETSAQIDAELEKSN